MQTVKMFGPSISDPSRIVNRDVPIADEQAYVRAGYRRGSVVEPVQAESPVETPEPVNTVSEPVVNQPPKPKARKKKAQSEDVQ